MGFQKRKMYESFLENVSLLKHLEKDVNELRQGEYFGELGLVNHMPRAATVAARDDVGVAFLDVTAFERLLGPCMDIMKRNMEEYEEQLVKVFGSKAKISGF